MNAKPASHCLLFDGRALVVMLEPDGDYEQDAYTMHAQSLASAATQLARTAREIVERQWPSGPDPEDSRKLCGLLVGIEVLGSLTEALTHDVSVNERSGGKERNR